MAFNIKFWTILWFVEKIYIYI